MVLVLMLPACFSGPVSVRVDGQEHCVTSILTSVRHTPVHTVVRALTVCSPTRVFVALDTPDLIAQLTSTNVFRALVVMVALALTLPPALWFQAHTISASAHPDMWGTTVRQMWMSARPTRAITKALAQLVTMHTLVPALKDLQV